MKQKNLPNQKKIRLVLSALRPESNQAGRAKPDPTIANYIVFDSLEMHKKIIT